MSRWRPVPVLVLFLAAIACGHGKVQTFGAFGGRIAPTPIPDLLASPELHLGQEVAVRGSVAQVCQEMGCWFEVTEGDKRLMIDLQMGRRFTIPKNAAGLIARVEGKLIRDEGVLKIIGEGVELLPPGSSGALPNPWYDFRNSRLRRWSPGDHQGEVP